MILWIDILIYALIIIAAIVIVFIFLKFARSAKKRSLIGILTPENQKAFAFNAGKDYVSIEMNRLVASGYMQYCAENNCNWIDEFIKNENDGKDIERDIEFIACDINLPNDICAPDQDNMKKMLVDQFKNGIESAF